MFWDKKRKASALPDLPMPPQIPPPIRDEFSYPQEENENSEEETHSLPSFPDSPVQKGFSQAAIKDAVSPPEFNNFTDYQDSSLPDLNEIEIKFPEKPKTHDEKKPVFVRLDKFQMAHASLEEMKQKIINIEETLRKIKDIKSKEDQELMFWEKEIEIMKTRINVIIRDIFERGEQ